jgi:hypothetical protein
MTETGPQVTMNGAFGPDFFFLIACLLYIANYMYGGEYNKVIASKIIQSVEKELCPDYFYDLLDFVQSDHSLYESIAYGANFTIPEMYICIKMNPRQDLVFGHFMNDWVVKDAADRIQFDIQLGKQPKNNYILALVDSESTLKDLKSKRWDLQTFVKVVPASNAPTSLVNNPQRLLCADNAGTYLFYFTTMVNTVNLKAVNWRNW